MTLIGSKLRRGFYTRPTLFVARELIGKTIVFNHPDGQVAATIVETEAYIGEDDPACHAAAGKTERNGIMYAKGGHSYIYFIYGMYHCLNVVTEGEGFPAAVLIRGAEPVAGLEIMARHSPPGQKYMTNGPGKLCRAFGLTREHNGLDLTGRRLYLIGGEAAEREVMASPRIGIRNGAKRPWRFFDRNSDCVSR